VLRLPGVDLCFWHPVGPHAGESLASIVSRKRRAVGRYGFTLWSFAAAKQQRVDAWRGELRESGQHKCVAVCCGETARDPMRSERDVHWASEYTRDLTKWEPLPSKRMTSYHRGPNSRGITSCAFVVEAIEAPDDLAVARPSSWFRAADGAWESGPVPTRGQYLVRMPAPEPGGRTVRVVLYLKAPFVVWLR
jgi:hypothetical protein